MSEAVSSAPKESLTRRAGLTMVSALLSQGALILAGLIVTPAIVSSLGDAQFGVWVVLTNMLGYLAAVDLRGATALRVALGTHQHDPDTTYKNRQIGAALFAWLAIAPIFLVLGTLLVMLLPRLTQAPETLVPVARVTMAMLVTFIVMDRLFSIPANILQGVNLEFRAMGFNAALTLIGGLLSIGTLRLGWGMPGLVIAMAGASFLNACARYRVARRELPWLGVAMPQGAEFRRFFSVSGWLLLANLGSTLLFGNQYVIIGSLLGPNNAAIYAATAGAINLTGLFVRRLFDSSSGGLSEIIGRKDWPRLNAIRDQMQTLTLGSMFVISACILALNQSFVGLWLGERLYAGQPLTVLLLCLAMMQMLFRADAFIASAMKRVRQSSIAALVAGVATAIVSVVLGSIWGITGVAGGALVGFTGLAIYLSWLVGSVTGRKWYVQWLPHGRLVTSGIALVTIGGFFSPWLRTHSLALFLAESTVAFAVGVAWVWLLGLNAQERIDLRKRFGRLRNGRPPEGQGAEESPSDSAFTAVRLD